MRIILNITTLKFELDLLNFSNLQEPCYLIDLFPLLWLLMKKNYLFIHSVLKKHELIVLFNYVESSMKSYKQKLQ